MLALRSLRGKAVLALGVAMALALGVSACGGGETTVTVTETVKAPTKQVPSTNPGDLQIEDGVVAGYTDHVKTEGDSMILTGWAASKSLSQPASKVAAIVEGKALAEAVPAIEREDVVEALGKPGLKNSGFELRLPLESLECGAPAAGVEVVATLDGKSGVLEYGEGIKEAVSDAC